MKKFAYPLFSIIVHEGQCDFFPEIQEELIAWIYQYQRSFVQSFNRSSIGGWQSPDFFHYEKSFSKFKDYILNNALKLSEEYNVKLNLINMWININKKGNFNSEHSHPGSDFSGVLWVKTPENCGVFRFTNPLEHISFKYVEMASKNMQEKYNLFHTFEFTPTEGTIIIFPSHLRHLVMPNESDEDRISIAFNFASS